MPVRSGEGASSVGGDQRLSKPTNAAQGVNGTCKSSDTASTLAKRPLLVSGGPRRCVFESTRGTYRKRARAANPHDFCVARGSQ